MLCVSAMVLALLNTLGMCARKISICNRLSNIFDMTDLEALPEHRLKIAFDNALPALGMKHLRRLFERVLSCLAKSGSLRSCVL
jgi:hypothetical protein